MTSVPLLQLNKNSIRKRKIKIHKHLGMKINFKVRRIAKQFCCSAHYCIVLSFQLPVHILAAIAIPCRSFIYRRYRYISRHTVSRSDCSVVYQARFQQSLPYTSRTGSSHGACFLIVSLSGSNNRHTGSTGPPRGGHSPIWLLPLVRFLQSPQWQHWATTWWTFTYLMLSGSNSRHIVLSRGACFAIWFVTMCQVPTIATLAALGHHVVAVDLPGYGKTKVSPGVVYLNWHFYKTNC